MSIAQIDVDVLYFNPLPPCGGRPGCADGLLCRGDFNPLPPCGGRQLQNRQSVVIHEFQSTPSVWRETAADGSSYSALPCISIHSLRVEGDILGVLETRWHIIFQSTPSVWRETCSHFSGYTGKDFNPLPPCGGRPAKTMQSVLFTLFQSTPSVWRETRFPVRTVPLPLNFNPLPPCGGRHVQQFSYSYTA